MGLWDEHGWAGAFSEHVLDAAARLDAAGRGSTVLLLVGDRGLMLAGERGMTVAWSAPMIVHAAQAAVS